jgi:hypothetical protein
MKRSSLLLLSGALMGFLLVCSAPRIEAQKRKQPLESRPADTLSQILGRPTDRSATLSLLSMEPGNACIEWGVRSGELTRKSETIEIQSGVPAEIEIADLQPNMRYYYRLNLKKRSQTTFRSEAECSFYTQRAPGNAFVFGVQGDSHPERRGKMFDAALYERTMRNVIKDQPDFYFALGDDFSIERLISNNILSQKNVDQVYAYQRDFLGLLGRYAPLFLVNGNHEQAARYLLDETDSNAAVLAARARNRFYPLPEPGRFYSGDMEKVENIGLLRDYYSWTWGDALFLVIDPYWHSPIAVDNKASAEGPREGRGKGENRKDGGKEKRDLWQATLGEEQYRWLVKTLSESKALWKFVFAHHVNGTGRGGIEEADLYEWGGKDRNGRYLFKEKRPGWPLPVHSLMAKNGVTIFFQGHDHLYARQELDGIDYQLVPQPAHRNNRSHNAVEYGYKNGVFLPNSGYLRVKVAPEQTKVEYVRSALSENDRIGIRNDSVGDSYVLLPRREGLHPK